MYAKWHVVIRGFGDTGRNGVNKRENEFIESISSQEFVSTKYSDEYM
jgi:hypothetical protein